VLVVVMAVTEEMAVRVALEALVGMLSMVTQYQANGLC
jgi:hypothetical protein